MTSQPETADQRGEPGAAAPPPSCPAHHDAVPLNELLITTEPRELHRRLRQEHGTVAPVMLPGDIPCWLVFGYRELHQVFSDAELFPRDSGLWNQWPRIPDDWPLLPMIGTRQPGIYYTTGAEHQRHAEMVNAALEAVNPFELRRHTEELADRLIDQFCAVGEADLIADYAKPLPVLVMARLLGFPDEITPELATAINALTDGGDDAIASHKFVQTVVHELIAEKRARPGADVASWMLAAPGDFTDEEYHLDISAVLVAGHVGTTDWIGNTLRLMFTDDRFAASLSGGRHSVAEAMNEVMWEDSPSQMLAGRWAARDTELGGKHIRAGDLLILGQAAANTDPQVRQPGQAYTGGNRAHFCFGHGEFRCPFPAQEIAEIMSRTSIEVILDRLPDIDLSVPGETLRRRPSPWVRGMVALPVRFTPTPALGGTP